MKFKSLLFILLLTGFCYSQKVKPVTIYLNDRLYLKTATDTIREIIALQQKLKLVDQPQAATVGNHYVKGIHVGNHYKVEDLTLVSIPVFRIERPAYFAYDYDTNIESYIAFNERLKYQRTLLFTGTKLLGSISIPNTEYEQDRIYSGTDLISNLDKAHYANSLFFYEDSEVEAYKAMLTDRNHFYFELFGLDGFLFDIEQGKIYAQFIGDFGGLLGPEQTPEQYAAMQHNLGTRAPINDYVRKNDMITRIKQLALGCYILDWDNPAVPPSKGTAGPTPEGAVVTVVKVK